jgi:hypothetical protein
MLPGDHSVSEVLKWSPEAAVGWVQQHRAAIDCSQEWQDLAYGCSSTSVCNSGRNDDELLAWATAAVVVYDRLGQTCVKPSGRRHAASVMSLRAFVINKLGSVCFSGVRRQQPTSRPSINNLPREAVLTDERSSVTRFPETP